MSTLEMECRRRYPDNFPVDIRPNRSPSSLSLSLSLSLSATKSADAENTQPNIYSMERSRSGSSKRLLDLAAFPYEFTRIVVQATACLLEIRC